MFNTCGLNTIVVMDWFKSYLCERYLCIKIGSVLSNAKKKKLPGICFHFYADDTELYVHRTHKYVT